MSACFVARTLLTSSRHISGLRYAQPVRDEIPRTALTRIIFFIITGLSLLRGGRAGRRCRRRRRRGLGRSGRSRRRRRLRGVGLLRIGLARRAVLGARRRAAVELVDVLLLLDDALFARLRIDLHLPRRDVPFDDEELDAAVLLFALFGRVVRDRLLLTPALRDEAGGFDALLLHEMSHDRLRTVVRELLVRLRITFRAGVALDRELLHLRVLLD